MRTNRSSSASAVRAYASTVSTDAPSPASRPDSAAAVAPLAYTRLVRAEGSWRRTVSRARTTSAGMAPSATTATSGSDSVRPSVNVSGTAAPGRQPFSRATQAVTATPGRAREPDSTVTRRARYASEGSSTP
jgi:hypothetical protein